MEAPPPDKLTAIHRVKRQAQHTQSAMTHDTVAVEEPLEIILELPTEKKLTLSITMRTPGNDQELAAGFLFTEGIVHSITDIRTIGHNRDAARPDNSLSVALTHSLHHDPEQFYRHFFTHSACGVCGKTSMQALELRHQPKLVPAAPVITASVLCELPERVRQHQEQFQKTGGIHAAALFSMTGELLLLREDVGRHNALDKLIGTLLLENRLHQAHQGILLVSGRTSFELVQKALMADIPILAAIGAPTSLALQLAQRHDMTLIGFLKNSGFNLYTGSERIAP